MTTNDPFFIPQTLRESLIAMAASGKTVDAMCQRMADEHLEKLAAIKLLREVTRSSLNQAKSNVHLSKAYSNRFAADNAFHASVLRALDEEDSLAASSNHRVDAKAS